jgi:hypothetical protein
MVSRRSSRALEQNEHCSQISVAISVVPSPDTAPLSACG